MRQQTLLGVERDFNGRQKLATHAPAARKNHSRWRIFKATVP
jgi:hypothetical protein